MVERNANENDFDPLDMDVSNTVSEAVTGDSVDDISIESSAVPLTAQDISEQNVSITSEYDQAVDRLLAQVINLNSDNILHEPTCIICRSPDREEIEQAWADSNKDYAVIRQILREKNNITRISKSTIQNHMIYHVDREIHEIQKIEYVNRIKRLNSFNLSTLERIRLGMSAITERLMGVNSIVPDANTSVADVEKIKTMETARLMGSMNQLLKLQAEMLGEMKSSGELVTIPREDFIRVFNEAIIEATNDIQRDAIKDILNKLAAISKAS